MGWNHQLVSPLVCVSVDFFSTGAVVGRDPGSTRTPWAYERVSVLRVRGQIEQEERLEAWDKGYTDLGLQPWNQLL